MNKDSQIWVKRVFSVPKTKGYRNEDSYQISDRRRICALSDGASISYDSASWSAILVRRYTRSPILDEDWLKERVSEFAMLHDRESLPWMKQAAFDKGSFATLLGVRFLDDNCTLEVVAIGDSLAVLCDKDEILLTFPYRNVEEFYASPQLLSSNPSENTFFCESGAQPFVTTWSLEGLSKPSLYCMSDALGLWLLENRANSPSPISVLSSLETKASFSNFVEQERKHGRLKPDDTTLITLW